ncbi:flagellar hook assembly protein FlgD [Alteromonas lipolytica]|uniref:Basal-body rod modification protein FlgD n=1 Tax=Alteromonas lipolytica TaxID=1856405 RepID=A0A1E8FG42_9ALTE|nr:flagellar hook assembly protein FlgD [Alteromonas lipolytica]OFI34558.1 flagellar biosynthesis protein FlgD [Alteromonas lipolytica]GGF52064.1 basal-body rod modification protein FlgD [Alteromonas lipolytica]
MSTISNTTTGLNNDLYWQEETVKVADGTEQSLSQEDFFALLTEQLANQDPTKPVDNDQMVSQMTQFTTADGINKLNEKFASFATSMTSNQALQASSLIGQDVLVEANVGYMGSEGAGISGFVVNDQTVQDMEITITNSTGEIVRTINAGTQAPGNIEFNWDGTDSSGNLMPPGEYQVSASGNVNGEGVAISTAVHRHVSSVSLAGSSQGIILNLEGDVSINLNDVIQIGS